VSRLLREEVEKSVVCSCWQLNQLLEYCDELEGTLERYHRIYREDGSDWFGLPEAELQARAMVFLKRSRELEEELERMSEEIKTSVVVGEIIKEKAREIANLREALEKSEDKRVSWMNAWTDDATELRDARTAISRAFATLERNVPFKGRSPWVNKAIKILFEALPKGWFDGGTESERTESHEAGTPDLSRLREADNSRGDDDQESR
jgi:hypothetical protein